MADAKHWSADEIRAYAERYGLTALDEPMLERLRELADKVTAASRDIPRMPRKDDEPAVVFAVPLYR